MSRLMSPYAAPLGDWMSSWLVSRFLSVAFRSPPTPIRVSVWEKLGSVAGCHACTEVAVCCEELEIEELELFSTFSRCVSKRFWRSPSRTSISWCSNGHFFY